MRSAEEFNQVQLLIAAGMNDCAIARQTGIPRPTVREWRRRPPNQLRRPNASSACGVFMIFRRFRMPRIRTYSVCISATAASREPAEFGACG